MPVEERSLTLARRLGETEQFAEIGFAYQLQ